MGLFQPAICALVLFLCASASEARRSQSFADSFGQALKSTKIEGIKRIRGGLVDNVDDLLKRILHDATDDAGMPAAYPPAYPSSYPPAYPPPGSPPPTPYRHRPPPVPFPPTPIRTYVCIADQRSMVYGTILDRVELPDTGDKLAEMCKLKCDQYNQEMKFCEAINVYTTGRCVLLSEIEGVMSASAVENLQDSCYVQGSWPKRP